ncbi:MULTISPECIES: FHA domain-containing protein [Pseudanabaena]|uniref:FHA domain containing protein n=2 Tax=Pseudanabaena TaxID=1152 RepID=L8N1T1_9CYAN|nr:MULTISPECIES: FHA domain-containing protein [Pseudanabaena]ELS32203.1 FHA domain containing protein [Pseudanabaena biceps PCC 7429]MDG3495542.1 FHA domain-containing protein [Pseudanabaena catenata USMAC16]
MITCPNCSHANPDGAVNCEACFTPLPIIKNIECPNCHATVLSDAKFCGHCGFNLMAATATNLLPNVSPENAIAPSVKVEPSSEGTAVPAELNNTSSSQSSSLAEEMTEGNSAESFVINSIPDTSAVSANPRFTEIEALLEAEANNPSPLGKAPMSSPASVKTQLQQFAASLLHVQTNLTIEIPAHLPVVHIGKPNTVIPPDIDVSGFPDSDIVSRIHADIRSDGGSFYFEDTGSSNGTYINNLPLPAGNRHKLRAGDRISLGKGDKVSFVFQLSS